MEPGGVKATLRRRLDRLEASTRRLVAVEPGPSVVPVIDGWLQAWGIVRGDNESRAEALARAMGMTSQELRAMIEGRTYGSQK